MNIGPIQPNLINLIDAESVRRAAEGRGRDGEIPMPDFDSIFSSTLYAAAAADHVNRQSAVELLTGQTDDLAGLMIDIQRAELSLNLAIQIRNRLVDAYTELMRMQV